MSAFYGDLSFSKSFGGHGVESIMITPERRWMQSRHHSQYSARTICWDFGLSLAGGEIDSLS
jgi:hypothetical protein